METEIPADEKPPDRPTFIEAFRVWRRIGLLSFGGPTGQISLMHAELVEKRRWISEERFLHALNYCMLLPGPEANQLAIYIGWLLHRTWGGIVAGVWFVLPGAVFMGILSSIYVLFGKVPAVESVFYGLKPVVMAIVASAVIRIGRKALKNEVMWSIAALAFVAIFYFKVPFPLIVLAGGILGLAGGRFLPGKFNIAVNHGGANGQEPTVVISDSVEQAHTRTTTLRTLAVAGVSLAIWFVPLAVTGACLGRDHTLYREGVFFSKAAVVTFGGAYAVLPYVARQAVEIQGWLSSTEMMDGLGLAETTPGPLILVLQFVGFLGGWHHPGELPPMAGAVLGALITSWMTFVPSFMFIFVGAPYIERMRENVRMSAALSAITAVVVGVILNLAVWFGMNVLFPEPGRVDWFVVTVSLAAFFGMSRWKWGVIPVVLSGGALGFVFKMIFH